MFSNIEHLLDANELIFRYNEKLHKFSLIQANFLMSTGYEGNEIYIFLAKKETGEYFCRSFFPKGNKDYTIGQTKYTLLYKEKINIATRESVVQYNRLKPTQ